MTDAPEPDATTREPAEGGELPDAGPGAEHANPHPTGERQAAENEELDPPA